MSIIREINNDFHNFAIAYKDTNHFDCYVKVYGKENIPSIVELMESHGYEKAKQEMWSYEYHIYGVGFNKKKEEIQ